MTRRRAFHPFRSFDGNVHFNNTSIYCHVVSIASQSLRWLHWWWILINMMLLCIITITITMNRLVYIRCTVLKSFPCPLLYRWSDEELRLATGSGGVTHVQHQLKLSSAYHGVPVRCLNLFTLLYFLVYLLGMLLNLFKWSILICTWGILRLISYTSERRWIL